MSREQAPRQRGLLIVSKAERLLIDLTPALNRAPKHQRYRFVARLENELWELIRRLIEAAMSGQKSKVYRADEQVRLVHALLRHAAEVKILTPKRVGNAAQQLQEVGAMIGHWRQKLGA